MQIPVELIVLVLTALGTGVIGLLTVVAHQLHDIGKTLSGIDKRNALEDERHENLKRDVNDIKARLDRKGVLA